jgi:hypothetical protein
MFPINTVIEWQATNYEHLTYNNKYPLLFVSRSLSPTPHAYKVNYNTSITKSKPSCCPVKAHVISHAQQIIHTLEEKRHVLFDEKAGEDYHLSGGVQGYPFHSSGGLKLE